MRFYKQSERTSSTGFIYVASKTVLYYDLAVHACTTLKDYFPDAHVTLFTHEKFLDDTCDIFDNVIVDIPVHYRSKMWCMARTPYDKTIYIDADSYICHKDIRTMHSYLDNCDMFFCPVTTYTVANVKWSYMDKAMTEAPSYHGAVCGYNKTDLTIDFMQTWFDEYVKQLSDKGWPYEANHYREWKIFDMFTLWRITTNRYGGFNRFKNLKIDRLPLRYIITAQHTASDKRASRPVIHQVDKVTWKGIAAFWDKFKLKENDPKYSFSDYALKFDITASEMEYN